MLNLRFARPHERAPHPPAENSPGLHVWLNQRGGVVAWGFRQAGSYWMAWPSLATYEFSPSDPFITAYSVPGAPVDVIWDTYRRSVLPMAMQVRGWEALHASAVVCRQGIVAFCAVSGTGKSTIAFGLRARGYPQWSDDGVVFKADQHSALATPLPFEVRLRPGSREIFGDSTPAAVRFQENEPGDQLHSAPLPFARLCVLTRASVEDGPRPQVAAVPPAAAFTALLTHAHEFDPSDNERRARMMQSYLDLAAHVPVCEVRFAPVREQLDELLDTIIERLALELPAAAAAGSLCTP
jgi:hypothetical protein